MSVVGRYRRLYPRLFRHPAFKTLTPFGQRLMLYVLVGPQSNRIGLFFFSVNTAAEDLGTTPETLRKGLNEVALSFGWFFDSVARVVFIPTWWRWNAPDHANILVGALKDLNEVPPCALSDRFATNLTYLKPELHETFVEACRIALPKASGSQEHYQENLQEKDQDGALRAATNGESKPSDAHRSIAKEALKLTNPEAPLDELVDTFGAVANLRNTKWTKASAVAAIQYERFASR